MRIEKSNRSAIKKVVLTIERMERYKSKLSEFTSAVGGTESEYSARLPSLLLTHFSDLKGAEAIIESGCLKVNEKGYISFTELNPLEFYTITQSKRRYGFGFFKDDLVGSDLELFSPIAFNREGEVAARLKALDPDLAKKIILEPTATQSGIVFTNLLEVRSLKEVTLDLCSLFFREDDLKDEHSALLQERGIFQLPHRVSWYRDKFLRSQYWHLSETGDYLEVHDNFNGVIPSANLIERLKTYI